MTNIFLGGINGVGKSSITKELSRIHPNVQSYTLSTELNQRLVRKYGAENIATISDFQRGLESEQMMQEALSVINSLPATRIFNSHFILSTDSGYEPGTGPWIKDFDGLIHLLSPAEIILHRIEKDEQTGVRKRSFFTTERSEKEKLLTINNFQENSLNAARRLSGELGIPLVEIVNNEDLIDNTLSAVNNFIELVSRRNPEK